MPLAQTALRTDTMGTPEGLKKTDIIIEGIYDESVMFPGKTFTPMKLNNVGKIEFPIVKKKSNGGKTGLGEAANVGDVAIETRTMDIDSKVSAKFDGIFTIVGIADKAWEKAMNTARLDIMKEDLQNDYMAILTATATAGTVTDAKTGASKLLRERNAYKKRTMGKMPTYAFISSDFETKLIEEKILRETTEGDRTLMQGTIGKYLGIELIHNHYLDDLGHDFIMARPEAVIEGVPLSTKDLAANILGDISKNPLVEFDGGLATFNVTDGEKGTITTFLHKYYGMAVSDAKWITISAKDVVKKA